MAVALVTAPDLHALTKGGRMRYVFSGSGRIVTTGSNAINALNFPGQPVPNGTRFVFRWAGRSVVLVAKTVPSEPNEIPAGDGGAAYVASLLPFFQEYFPFREDFTVSLDNIGASNSLIFEANKPGPTYNFSPVDASANFPANIDDRFPADDPLVRERYSVYVELHRQKPGTVGTALTDFERIFSSSIETDEQGVAEFDAGDLLHGELGADWPDWNTASATECVRSHRRYYISYSEAWGSPLLIGRVKNDTIRHAYLGGADYVRRAGGGFDLADFVTGINPTEDKALRLGTATRYVRADEPQFLTFLNARTAVNAWLRIRLIFDDGTGLNVTNAVPAFALGVGEKWTAPVGIGQLALLDRVPAGRTLVEYTVRLSTAGSDPNGNAHLSQDYRFIVSGNYEQYVRHFGYLNSLGSVETLTTYGKGSHELTRFYEQAERALTAQYDVKDGQFVDYDVAVQQQVEVATGFRSKAELQHWSDFYRSPVRFRLRQQGAAWEVLPIGLISKSIKQAKDGDTLFAHRFEYAYLFRDDFFSATEDTALLGDGVPPPGFVPGGPITINQPVVVDSVDRTVPDIVRTLTPAQIASFKVAAARPNPETLGFLSQSAADALYYRKTQKIDYLTDLINKPVVATPAETAYQTHNFLKNVIGLRPRLSSWTTEVEPT